MTITTAVPEELTKIQCLDSHIPIDRLLHCIEHQQILVLKDGSSVMGILRWSLFWQSIPFLDLIILNEHCRGQGWGNAMMDQWEAAMKQMGYSYVMTSTQADESAWQFYEKRGYTQTGSFLPPDQEAPELIYGKSIPL